MDFPSVTPSPVVDRILAGYFQEKTGYDVLRPAGTSDWLLIYTIRGAGDFGYGPAGSGKSLARSIASPGDAMLIRPGTLHDYRVHAPAKRWDLLWAHFYPRPDWHAWLDWPAVSSTLPGLMQLSIDNAGEREIVERALRKMNALAVGSHRLSMSMAMNALEEALLWCAKRIFRSAGHDPRIEEAEAYLCRNLRDNVTLDDLADAVGLSVSRLSFLFKQQTGITPQRYFELQRLERARQLLGMTTLPIKAIATQIGFDNPFYFTLRFKRYTGKSPREYRKHLVRES
jgi:AraC family transcriptional regulator of arabinose operon